MPMARRLLGAMTLVCLISAAVLADEVIFNQNTHITCDDFTWDGFDIVVDRAVVTIDCRHEFNSVRVINGGIITHSPETPMHLVVAGDMFVDITSSVDVSGRGYASGTGPGAGSSGVEGSGGGSYGGAGGNGRLLPAGGTYGSWQDPNEMGSGGGSSLSGPGGAGGGSVRLEVGGELNLIGIITTTGLKGIRQSGGGSGGSVNIIANSFVGTGGVYANGGEVDFEDGGGGGGGGRIAIRADAWQFSGVIQALSREVFAYIGGAGTQFIQVGVERGTLYIDNGGRQGGAITEFNQPTVVDANVVVRNGGRVGHPPQSEGGAGLFLHVLGDVLIESQGQIQVGGCGYASGTGPGAGSSGFSGAGGGGYGGAGSNGSVLRGGGTYGSWAEPNEFGSGGGESTSSGLGGAGGGIIHLQVDGELDVRGLISANGLKAVRQSGAGSGGAIQIVAAHLTGSGTIEALGGSVDFEDGGGAGGGGRIAIYAGAYEFSGAVSARTIETLAYFGGAGTVFIKEGDQPGTLIIDNGGRFGGAVTEFNQPTVIDGNVIIRNGGRLGHPVGTPNFPYPGLFLTVLGDAVIEPSGAIEVSGRGYGPGEGPGAGLDSVSGGSGAGYGGVGGASSAVSGGDSYGDRFEPIDPGSGGGMATGTGGWGAGSIRLEVAGTLEISGRIDANGFSGVSGGGGGSGGSIYLRANEIVGFGIVSARGGSGVSGGGGGAGGRIAIHAERWDTFPVANAQVAGGAGFRPGEAGTVSFYQVAPPDGVRVTSSNEIWALPVDPQIGITQQIDLLNNAPPAFDPATWTLLGAANRRNANNGIGASFRCGEVPDPMLEPFVSVEEHLDADEVSLNNCNSAWYRVTFELPQEFTNPVLFGWANVDDQGVIFLNGTPITALMINPNCNPGCPGHDVGKDRYDSEFRWVMTSPTLDPFGTFEESLFVPGENELIFAVVGDASEFEPTGIEFEAIVDFDGPPYELTIEPKPLKAGQPATLRLEGATPNAPQYFVYSLRGIGSTFVPPLNVTLDLADPELIGSVNADAIGEAELNQRIPTQARNRFVWFQAAQREAATNVVVTNVE